jgi:hypothetical protein
MLSYKAFCDPEGTRTPNLLGRNQVLYPIKLRNQNSALSVSVKRGANIEIMHESKNHFR